jgi:hypothetical protein
MTKKSQRREIFEEALIEEGLELEMEDKKVWVGLVS